MGNRLQGLISRPSAPLDSRTPLAVTEGVPITQVNPGARVLFNPTADGWDIVERTLDCNIWRNRNTGEQAQEYRVVANDQFQFVDAEKSFNLRYNSPTLVASLFFKDETQSQLCSKYYKGNLYLQRVPLRLSDIDEIPFPDVLHIYSQCFKGYAELYDAMGYFDIIQEMIGINSAGVVKVWLNKNLDRYLPPVNYHNGNQREMVLKVLRIVSQNTNQTTLPDRISDWIIRSDPYTFRDAFSSLEGYASRYNTNIPLALNCVVNFMRLKYVEEEEIYEGPPVDFDFNLPSPGIDIAGANQIIAESAHPIFQNQFSQYHQYSPPPMPLSPLPVPSSITKVVTQSIRMKPLQPPFHQVHTKRRRILQHKDHPVIYSNIVKDSNSQRIPMSSIGSSPQNLIENRITFGQPVQPAESNAYSSQNPFKSVLQKLKISNHYKPNAPAQVPSQSIYLPEKDYIKQVSYESNPYVSSSYRQSVYSYQPQAIVSGGGFVANSIDPKYSVYSNYKAYDPIDEGKSSPQILALARNYHSSSDFKPSSYQSANSQKYESQIPYKYEVPPPIISQTSSGAVYKDTGNTSLLVDTFNRNNESISFTGNKVEIFEEISVEKKSIYRQEINRQKTNEIRSFNIDQEIQKDLIKLRNSKASKGSSYK